MDKVLKYPNNSVLSTVLQISFLYYDCPGFLSSLATGPAAAFSPPLGYMYGPQAHSSASNGAAAALWVALVADLQRMWHCPRHP